MPKQLAEQLRKINWDSPIVNAVLNSVAVILAAVLTVLVPVVLAGPKSPSLTPVDDYVIRDLKRIGKQAEYEIKESPPIDDHLIGLLSKANYKLFEHYWALEKEQNSAKTDVVYLIGPAGAGKSTLLRNFRPGEACLVDLKKAFEKPGPLSKHSIMKTDLKVGNGRFNELAGPSDQPFSLTDILNGGGCCPSGTCKRLVILDALDELHPDLATLVLRIINDDLHANTASPMPSWLLVAGRPEGFHYYLKDRSTVPAGVTVIQFELPTYDTRGKLNALLENLYGNETRPLTPEEKQGFADLISKNPWLSYTIRYLSYARSLNELVRVDRSENYVDLQDTMFDDVLESNFESHRRPTENSGLYVGLLEEVAAMYAKEASIQNGYFFVNFEQSIKIYAQDESRTELGELKIREILNRSGIAYLDPAEIRRTRYRFQPQWMHAYLAERWNRRILKPRNFGYWMVKGKI